MIEKKVNQRIFYLDFLRAFAMLYIVLIHHADDYANHLFNNKIDDILTYSLLGLFVFLSGYLLVLGNPINNSNDVKKFLTKRFLRIYPLYLFSLVLFWIFFPNKLPAHSLLQHALLLNMLTNTSIFTLWFVSMICIYYLLFPVFLFRYSWQRILIICLSLCALFLFTHIFFGIIDKRLFIYLPLFALGLIVAKQKLMDFLQQRYVLLLSLLMFGGGVIMFFATQSSNLNYIVQPFFMGCSVPALLYFGKKGGGIIFPDLYEKFAYASLCIYLFHRVVYYLLLKLYWPPNDIATVCYLIFFGGPILFFLSYFTQKQYDFLLTKFNPGRIK